MRREIVVLEDDLDGGEAHETVKYALDGVMYEIDLSDKNAAKLRERLADFVASSRRLGRGGVALRHTYVAAQSGTAKRREDKEIRDWATERGFKVADRGRIAQHIVDEYRAAKASGKRTGTGPQFSGA